MGELRVWAPDAERVDAVVGEQRRAMEPEEGGWWRVVDDHIRPGTDYAFSLDGGDPRPDPRSRWQPEGVHGPSRVVDPTDFEWSDDGWRGFHLPSAVLYELHIGTFSPEGTFDGAIQRLDHLVELGITAVSILPVNAFPGRHGWGYDGVDLWAVHDPYGGPTGLNRFVDACHGRGLGVVLDVVYNHLGPSGNYLGDFGPYFTDRYATPWGQAPNLDGEGSDEVRRYFIENALMWLRDYHIDGLRLDAVHAIFDMSAVHLLEQLATEVEALAAALGRPLWLIAESDLNDPRLLWSRDRGGYGLDAQWSDDFHHAVHAALTGEHAGYYADFGGVGPIARALRHAYVYAGHRSGYRGRRHGRPADGLAGHRFLGYIQNHDQVGNRARGDRIDRAASVDLQLVGAALLLTAPFVPMIFQGEEWAASSPFQYFTDHDDPVLADAVREGRKSEFAAFGWDPEDVPDPQDPRTFERSKLDWNERSDPRHARVEDWYRRLIRLRRDSPDLLDPRLDVVVTQPDEDEGTLVARRRDIVLCCNLGEGRRTVRVPDTDGGGWTLALASHDDARLEDDAAILPPAAAVILRR